MRLLDDRRSAYRRHTLYCRSVGVRPSGLYRPVLCCDHRAHYQLQNRYPKPALSGSTCPTTPATEAASGLLTQRLHHQRRLQHHMAATAQADDAIPDTRAAPVGLTSGAVRQCMGGGSRKGGPVTGGAAPQPPTHGTLLQLTYPTGRRRQCPKAWLEVLHRAAQHPCAIQYDPLTKQFSVHNTLRNACAAAMQHTYMSWHALPTRTT
jgi:hypothetical protein